jgi:hypothetical protein
MDTNYIVLKLMEPVCPTKNKALQVVELEGFI